MKVLSVNVGEIKSYTWEGRVVETAIFKYPVNEALQVFDLSLDGDAQADLKHHGGQDKAVYSYAIEDYEFWKKDLGEKTLDFGVFGENLSTEGLRDSAVCIGDQFEIGETILMAIQPRIPCYKLGLRFQDAAMTNRFMQARRNGIYFRVIKTGKIQKGDSIRLYKKSVYELTIQQIVDCFVLKNKEQKVLAQIVENPLMPAALKMHFNKFLKS